MRRFHAGIHCYKGPSILKRRTIRLRDDSLVIKQKVSNLTDTHQLFPPSLYSPKNLLAEITDNNKYQSFDEIWQSPTLREAWQSFDNLFRQFQKNEDQLQLETIMRKDLQGLAICTGKAELRTLGEIFPESLRKAIMQSDIVQSGALEEIYLHLGSDIELRDAKNVLCLPPPSLEELTYVIRHINGFQETGRGCIPWTFHRISVWRDRSRKIHGVTIRVGRYIASCARSLLPIARMGSTLIIARPGVGKTTMLRDLAASLGRLPDFPRVLVIDTSNEIGGDHSISLPYLGRVRRLQVPQRESQHQVMLEGLQNHTPEYLIVDELSTQDEAMSVWSLSQRGVILIATCHGDSLAQVIKNRDIQMLVGGITTGWLSSTERQSRHRARKAIQERRHDAPFSFVVELSSRDKGYVYTDVNGAVDAILNDDDPKNNNYFGEPIFFNEALSPSLIRKLKIFQQPKSCSETSNHTSPYTKTKNQSFAHQEPKC